MYPEPKSVHVVYIDGRSDAMIRCTLFPEPFTDWQKQRKHAIARSGLEVVQTNTAVRAPRDSAVCGHQSSRTRHQHVQVHPRMNVRCSICGGRYGVQRAAEVVAALDKPLCSAIDVCGETYE